VATHDYVIANGTGAAVRSDLNDALAAIVSQNSSATAPATTYAYMRWADTTAGVMKMRNGANSSWITLYQLDGEYTTIAIENGTAAAPAFYFKDSGTDTGIYSSGTDALDFSTGGTRRLGIGSAGDVTVYTGNVTINAQGDLRFADSDSSNWVAFQAPATVASNVTWTLPSTDGTAGQLLSTNGSGTLSWATDGGGAKIEVGNTKAEVTDTGSNGQFSVTTEGSERFRVASDGAISAVVPGGTTLYPSFACRAWVNFNGTGTVAIRASGNVSSITDNGVGDYTVNLTTALTDTNAAPVTSGMRFGASVSRAGKVDANIASTTTVRLLTGYEDSYSGQIPVDLEFTHVAIFR
jgi:hypothetical protein